MNGGEGEEVSTDRTEGCVVAEQRWESRSHKPRDPQGIGRAQGSTALPHRLPDCLQKVQPQTLTLPSRTVLSTPRTPSSQLPGGGGELTHLHVISLGCNSRAKLDPLKGQRQPWGGAGAGASGQKPDGATVLLPRTCLAVPGSQPDCGYGDPSSAALAV